MTRVFQLLRWLSLYILVALVAVVMLDSGLELLLREPARIPESFLPLAREYYLFNDRSIVQFDPACAVHDPRLTYRLQPGGRCVFANREFETRVAGNASGLRDDEASLRAPSIVVLGDSHAMGWGVEASESFPEQLGEILGRPVLNAGISSYGTAREVRLLDKLDLSALEWLVVQYSRNDVLENLALARGKGVLPLTSADDFATVQAGHAAQTAWFPGKHVASLLSLGIAGPAGWQGPAIEAQLAPYGARRQAELFVAALARAPIPWDRAQVLVTAVDGRDGAPPGFLDALRRRLAASPLPAERFVLVDVAAGLDASHHFVLDDHMRPAGHRVVAERLAAAVRASEAAEPAASRPLR